MDLMQIPESMQSEEAAKSIYLLLCHKKVSLRENYIRSEFAALFKGCLNKIKLPYYSIFFRTFRQARRRFFEEEIILFLWTRFCKECTWVFDAIQKVDQMRSEFFRTVRFVSEVEDLNKHVGALILPATVNFNA